MFRFLLLLVLTSLVSSQTNPVTVTLFYESLCPGCREFIQDTLPDAIEKLGSAMVLDMLPYGNAKATKTDDQWTVVCQHGEKECYGNEIEACVLQNKSLSFDVQFAFIECLEKTTDFNIDGPVCSKKHNLDWEALQECANSEVGFEYLLAYGNTTETFFKQGGQQWTPYIAYNNIKDDTVANDALDDFIGTTCKYISEPKPKSCNNENGVKSNSISYEKTFKNQKFIQ